MSGSPTSTEGPKSANPPMSASHISLKPVSSSAAGAGANSRSGDTTGHGSVAGANSRSRSTGAGANSSSGVAGSGANSRSGVAGSGANSRSSDATTLRETKTAHAQTSTGSSHVKAGNNSSSFAGNKAKRKSGSVGAGKK